MNRMSGTMKTLSVSEFKATCSSVLEQVRRDRRSVLLTKRGVPIAEIVPVKTKEKAVPLKASLKFMRDIASPVAEDEWEVQK
jgi:prevent-host-death family protein